MVEQSPRQGELPLRVFLVSEAMGGGIREHVLQLLFGLRERGWDVGFAFSPSCADPAFHAQRRELETAGVSIFPLPMRRRPFALGNLVSCVRLVRLLRRFRPDVVHAHGAIGGAVGRVAARLAGVRVVVYSPHGGSLHEVYGRMTWVYAAIEKLLLLGTDAVILISEWLRDRCAKMVGCSPDKMYVIPIGIDISAFSPSNVYDRQTARAAIGVPPDATVFLCVGILRPIKGQDLLIRAFQRVHNQGPGSRLILVGEGEWRSTMQELAQSLGLGSSVQFAGFVDDVSVYLLAADVYVQPSRADASSYSIMEAMASGLPVIGTSVAALPEIIQESQSGLLVPPEDADAMATAMVLLAGNLELRHRMGVAGRKRINDCFQVESMIRRTEQIYLGCLGIERARNFAACSKE